MLIQKFQNAYEISISKKANTLEFTTHNNIDYEIYTGLGNQIIPGFVFTSDITYFGFHPKGQSVSDEKVMLTVINFILDILEEPNAIAAYIHSSEGNKHEVRERYFNSLFNKLNTGILQKIIFNLKDDGNAVIIFRSDNININAINNLTAEEIIARMEEKESYDEYYR